MVDNSRMKGEAEGIQSSGNGASEGTLFAGKEDNHMATGLESHPWEVTSEKVEAVVRQIVEISQPVKIIIQG